MAAKLPELDGVTIAAMFEFTRPVYGKEANYSENANVLDADYLRIDGKRSGGHGRVGTA